MGVCIVIECQPKREEKQIVFYSQIRSVVLKLIAQLWGPPQTHEIRYLGLKCRHVWLKYRHVKKFIARSLDNFNVLSRLITSGLPESFALEVAGHKPLGWG